MLGRKKANPYPSTRRTIFFQLGKKRSLNLTMSFPKPFRMPRKDGSLVGVDVGLESFATLSNGETIAKGSLTSDAILPIRLVGIWLTGSV